MHIKKAQRGRPQESANNRLADRENTARLNGRIPDIFGTVRSTPDLLATPYRLYENHQEVEHSFMCIGRGEYDVSEIKDGDTLVSEISGASVEVYGPDKVAPQVTVGDPIDEPVYQVVTSNSVNGQTLFAPNSRSIKGSEDIAFRSPDQILARRDGVDQNEQIDFTEHFEAGDTITVSNIDNSEFRGSYNILAVTAGVITLSAPNWQFSGTSGWESPVIS